MQALKFWKMDGAGNDFVVLDNRDLKLSLSKGQIETLCQRHRGVGTDGMLIAEPGENGEGFRMRYYNSDGGEAEMCGNGARCFARFLNFLHDGSLDSVSFSTIAGTIHATFPGDDVCINLSEPFDLSMGANLEIEGMTLEVHSVNTGVPHAVLVLDDLAAIDIRKLGAGVRYHEQYAPKGTNVNFMKVNAPGDLTIRTYERGVEDETLACGTGMVANAIIHHQLENVPSPISVKVAGGDVLAVGFDYDGKQYSNVTLTGPADFIFEGTFEIEST